MGGMGAHAWIYAGSSNSGGMFVSGSVMTMGGDGSEGGGSGSDIYLETSSVGAIVLSPTTTLDSSGGNATTDGNGGDAGYVNFYAYSGTIRASGSYTARGGNGAGTGDGGNGDQIYAQIENDNSIENSTAGGLGMYVGADMDASGGTGVNGGGAGDVSFYANGQGNDSYAEHGVEPLMFLGYASIDASGGDGTINGGAGGDTCYIETYVGSYDDDGNYQAAGDIVNEVPWTSNGGNGGTGSGGDGGEIYFDVESGYLLPKAPSLTNSAALTNNGGTGDEGGDGGYIYLYAQNVLTNSGVLASNGGEGESEGGWGGGIDLASDFELNNTANLSSMGGDATDTAGGGEYVGVRARRLSHAGDVNAAGGDSVDGFGGEGDMIEFRATEESPELSGLMTVAGGSSTNGTDGDVGSVFASGSRLALDTNGEVEL